jgi:putative peptidoglycan lipid II flippase
MLALMLAVPASVGYVAVAGPVAHAVGVGRLATESGYVMVTGALAALALGLLGQTIFFIATQASYARGDTRAPLRSMALQTAVCLLLCVGAVFVTDGTQLPAAVAGAYAVASLVGAGDLLLRVVHRSRPLLRRLGCSFLRVLVCAAVMVPPVRLVVAASRDLVPGRPGWILALVAGSVAGVIVYLVAHLTIRSPELRSLRSALRRPERAPSARMPS